MEGRVNYTVVGIFVIALTVVFIAMIFWLSSIGHAEKYNTYLVYVHEDVTGLGVESPVRFNGVQVGYVKSIDLDRYNSRLVCLSLQVNANVRITTSTYATLNAQGITGVIYVNLKSVAVNAPRLVAKPGEPYPIIPAKPSLLVQLSEVLPEVTKDIQQLSASIAQVLNAHNQEAIADTLKNMANITHNLSDNSHNISESLETLRDTLSHISEASEQFPDVIKQLQTTLSSVDQLSTHVTQTADSISSTMRSSERAIHNLSNQIMPNAEQTLLGLQSTTMRMNQFVQTLQNDPSILVRGRKPQPLGPGESE